MAHKEGEFGLKHAFMTVALSVATTMIVGPMLEFNWTHFSQVGQALAQIGNHLFMPTFDAIGTVAMPFLNPITDSLGVTAQFASVTTDGAKVLGAGTSAVSAGSSSMPMLNPLPALAG